MPQCNWPLRIFQSACSQDLHRQSARTKCSARDRLRGSETRDVPIVTQSLRFTQSRQSRHWEGARALQGWASVLHTHKQICAETLNTYAQACKIIELFGIEHVKNYNYACACVDARMHARMYASMFPCVHLCMSICTYGCKHIWCIYVCMHGCMHVKCVSTWNLPDPFLMTVLLGPCICVICWKTAQTFEKGLGRFHPLVSWLATLLDEIMPINELPPRRNVSNRCDMIRGHRCFKDPQHPKIYSEVWKRMGWVMVVFKILERNLFGKTRRSIWKCPDTSVFGSQKTF